MRAFQVAAGGEATATTARAPEPAPEPQAPVAPRFRLGDPGDPAEAAADRLADHVVAGEPARTPIPARRPATPATLMTRRGSPVDGGLARDIAAARRGGSPLTPRARADAEQAFGADLSPVRLHSGPRAGDLCDRVQARAFTVGADIFFRRGRPDPARPADRHLLAHELAHVVQGSTGAGVIRRAHLDGQRDWQADTAATRPSRFGGGTTPVGRSRRLKAVDRAVTRLSTAYKAGDVAGLDRGLPVLQRAITAWRAKRPVGQARVRRTQVDALALEANGLRTVVDQWLAGHQAALDLAEQNRGIVAQWLAAGRNAYVHPPGNYERGHRLRNACEWIQAGRTKLYVLTQTPDAAYRAQLHLGKATRNEAPRHTAYFPNPTNPDATYDRATVGYDQANARSDTTLVHTTTNAWRRRNGIVVTDTVIGAGTDAERADFYVALRHEVQHAADRFLDRELSAGLTGPGGRARTGDALTFNRALREYKTEFRAHWYQGDVVIDALGTDPVRGEMDLDWSPRQRHIVDHLRTHYRRITEAWGPVGPGARPSVWNMWFRREVQAYQLPDTEGFNKYNSLRIDALYEALGGVPAQRSDPDDPDLVPVYDAARGLQQLDVEYIRDGDESVMLRRKLYAALGGDARDDFRAILHTIVPLDADPVPDPVPEPDPEPEPDPGQAQQQAQEPVPDQPQAQAQIPVPVPGQAQGQGQQQVQAQVPTPVQEQEQAQVPVPTLPVEDPEQEREPVT